MSSYVSDSLKSKARAAYSRLHDTFKRTVTAYKTAKIVQIATDETYNALYSTGTTEIIDYETVSSTFEARIIYEKMDQKTMGDEAYFQQLKINMTHGWIRIIVDSDGYDFIKEGRRVEVDGKTYSIKSDGLAHGFWEPQYYEFLLTPVDE